MDVLTCVDMGERLYDYIDREMSLEEEVAVRRHLASCEPCQGQVVFEEQFLAAVREKCRATRAPAGLLERIQQSIERL
jgi:mycothiol system anti-sigma-R factor